MADNVTLDGPGSGGSVIATDDIGSVHYPISKIAFGALDTANLVDSTTTNPLPVALSDTDNAVLDAIDAVLDTINAKLVAGTVIGEVVGDAAHDAAVTGNPVLVGIEARTTEPTAVGDGDVVRILSTALGKQVVYPFAIPQSSWSYASAAAVTDTADDEAKAAGGAGVRNYITGVQVFNSHDTTGTAVVIKDGSTVIWQGWAEQTGGGCSAVFNPPLRGTAATAVNVANITTSSSTFFNLQGFTALD